MPFLTYPLALIALVGLPVLVGIYFLRNRFREQPVSSLMLWAFAARVREGGTRVRRMVMPLVFFLEMLALLLLILAAVDVRWPLSRSRWPVFVVLDDSVSMLAGAGRETPRERAAREVQRLARGGQRPFRFILAGKNPRVLETHGSSVSEALRGWTCASASACLERATTLACELGGPRSSILVLTDHKPPGGLSEGAKVRWLAFGKPLPNAGIVAAARTPTDKKDRAFLEVAAFAPEPVRTSLVMADEAGRELLRRTLTLQPAAVERLVFDVPREVQVLHAALSEDALDKDNHAYLLSRPDRNVRVLLDLADASVRELFDKGLTATTLRSCVTANPELVVSDRTEPKASDGFGWTLRVATGKGAKAFTGPFVSDTAHPLMKGVSLDGVIWGTSGGQDLPGVPVVTAGDVPLISDHALPSGRHEIHLNFSPDASTLQDTPNWPIFLWNLLTWRAAESPGISALNVRLGDEALLTTGPGKQRIRIVSPDGRAAEVESEGVRLAIQARQTGVYQVSTPHLTSAFACNLLSAEESDLRQRASGEWGGWLDEETARREYSSTSWAFILAAMALLVAHLAVVARGSGHG